MVDTYLSILDLGYHETKDAFDGLADENIWKRPTEGLLSIGEICGHVAYWEAIKLAGEGGQPQPDLAKCRVTSPLIDHRFRYYSTSIATPPSKEHLAMTADQVRSELLRVHNEAVAHFTALNPSLASTPPGWPSPYTYDWMLKYAVFHVSYHVGQIYSVRHLLGEKTPDN